MLLWEAGGGTLPPSPSDLPPGDRVGSSGKRVAFLFRWRHPGAGSRNWEDTGGIHTASGVYRQTLESVCLAWSSSLPFSSGVPLAKLLNLLYLNFSIEKAEITMHGHAWKGWGRTEWDHLCNALWVCQALSNVGYWYCTTNELTDQKSRVCSWMHGV